jgi:hypothetical protein
MPGGSKVGIEIEVGIKKLEPTFKLVGFDPELLTQFGLGSRIKHIYTAYGEIRERRTGASIELRAVMEARLGKIESDTFKRGDLMATDYALHEVTHYEVYFNTEEKWFWDSRPTRCASMRRLSPDHEHDSSHSARRNRRASNGGETVHECEDARSAARIAGHNLQALAPRHL